MKSRKGELTDDLPIRVDRHDVAVQALGFYGGLSPRSHRTTALGALAAWLILAGQRPTLCRTKGTLLRRPRHFHEDDWSPSRRQVPVDRWRKPPEEQRLNRPVTRLVAVSTRELDGTFHRFQCRLPAPSSVNRKLRCVLVDQQPAQNRPSWSSQNCVVSAGSRPHARGGTTGVCCEFVMLETQTELGRAPSRSSD